MRHVNANPSAVPPELPKPDSLPARLLKAVVRKIVGWGILICIVGLIGYCASDRKDYPGKTQFEVADGKIAFRQKNLPTASGNTEAAQAAAAKFSAATKVLQGVMFKGGSGFSPASGGEFLTYLHHRPDSLVVLVHVPELRNYKDRKTRDALAAMVWNMAGAAAEDLKFGPEPAALLVGLRGFSSYGPIWSGKLGKDADTKTDDPDEKRRIYPFFAERAETKK